MKSDSFSAKVILLLLAGSASSFAAPSFERVAKRAVHLVPGTRSNDPAITGPGFASSRNGGITPDASNKWADYQRQPVVASSSCAYSYVSTLSGSSVQGALLSSNPTLPLDAVKQGPIGDCDYGAVMLSLLNNTAYSKRIGSSLKRVGSSSTGVYFDMAFLDVDSGNKTVMHIDDKLPKSSDTSGSCWVWGSFQGVDLSNTQSNNPADKTLTLFVPLIEKAFVKYLDLHPDLKSYNNLGYAGITAISAYAPMVALSGNANVQTAFTSNGPGVLDTAWAASIKNILYKSVQPAMLGTRPVSDLASFPGYNATTNTAPIGKLTIGVCSNGYSWQIGQNCIIGNHAYAVMRKTSKPSSSYILLRNPWGFNPTPSNDFAASPYVIPVMDYLPYVMRFSTHL